MTSPSETVPTECRPSSAEPAGEPIDSSDLTSPGALGDIQQPLVLRLTGAGREGQVLQLRSQKCAIGAGASCTLRLHRAGLMPLHCVILRGVRGAAVRKWSPDTRLNGRDFQDAPLFNGDRLSFGRIDVEVLDGATRRGDLSVNPQPDSSPTATISDPEAVVRLAAAERQRDVLRRRLEEQAKQQAEREKSISDLERLVETAAAEKSDLEGQLGDLRSKLADLQTKLGDLQEKLADLQEKNTVLEAERSQFHQEEARLRQQRDTWKAEAESLQQQRTAADAPATCQTCEQRAAELADKEAHWLAEEESRQQELDALRQERTRLLSEQADFLRETAALKSSLAALRQELSGIQAIAAQQSDSAASGPVEPVARAETPFVPDDFLNNVQDETPNREAKTADDGDESIEEYMQRLLQRSRGEPAPLARSNDKTARSAWRGEVRGESGEAAGAGHAHVLPAGAVAAAAVAAAPPATPPTMLPEEFAPRSEAPELHVDMQTMREIANSTARTAVKRSLRQRKSVEYSVRLIVAMVCFAAAGVLFLQSEGRLGIQLLSAVVGVAGGVWCSVRLAIVAVRTARVALRRTASPTPR